MMTEPPDKKSSEDLNVSLRRKTEDIIRVIVEKCLPKSVEILHNNHPSKRKRIQSPGRDEARSRTLIVEPNCEVCNEKFERYPDIVKHLKTHKETLDKALECRLCQFSSTKPKVLACHIEDTHLNAKFKCGSANTFHCNICRESFWSISALAKHKKSYHRGSDIPQCPKCNVLFEFPGQLASHLKYSTTCGNSKLNSSESEANKYLRLPPTRGAPSKNTANMVGNALLNALNTSTDTNNTVPSVLNTPNTSIGSLNTAGNLIMDPTTGIPIPVAQFVEKRQAEIAGGLDPVQINKFKCSTCNRSFTTRSMLVHHNEQVHLRKKTLSCSQCHLLFATFPELDSHFHRIHRQRKPSKHAAPTTALPNQSAADTKIAVKPEVEPEVKKHEIEMKRKRTKASQRKPVNVKTVVSIPEEADHVEGNNVDTSEKGIEIVNLGKENDKNKEESLEKNDDTSASDDQINIPVRTRRGRSAARLKH